MSFATDLRDDLVADTAVNGLVNGNVNPLVDKSQELPSIIYKIENSQRVTKFVNSYGHRSRNVTLDFYTTDYNQLDIFQEAINRLYNGTSRQFASTGNFFGYARVENIIETFDTSDDKVFRCIINILFIN